jgi:hypothetical protein
MFEWAILNKEIIHYFKIPIFLFGFYGWGFVSIILHEIGHTVVAYLTGLSPYRVEIGSGKKHRFSFWFTYINIVLLERPYGGATFYFHMFRKGLWWKGSLVSIAGIFADILVLILLFGLGILSNSFMSKTVETVLVAAIICQMLQIIFNLPPRDIKRNENKMPNDTKKLWIYLSSKYKYNIDIAAEKIKNDIARYSEKFDESSMFIARADSTLLSMYLNAMIDFKDNRYLDAILKFQQILNSSILSDGERAQILDILASLPIVTGDNKYVSEAMDWCKQAKKIAPHSKTILGTFGSLLIEKGDIEQGVKVLLPIAELENDSNDKAISCFYLAKAYNESGQHELAESWFNRGRIIGNPYGIYDRIDK